MFYHQECIYICVCVCSSLGRQTLNCRLIHEPPSSHPFARSSPMEPMRSRPLGLYNLAQDSRPAHPRMPDVVDLTVEPRQTDAPRTSQGLSGALSTGEETDSEPDYVNLVKTRTSSPRPSSCFYCARCNGPLQDTAIRRICGCVSPLLLLVACTYAYRRPISSIVTHATIMPKNDGAEMISYATYRTTQRRVDVLDKSSLHLALNAPSASRAFILAEARL